MEIIFFGNEACPYCQRVLSKLEEKGVSFEFNEIPMDRSVRGEIVYSGSSEGLKGKTFGSLFDRNISIPKMIVDGKTFLESDEMVAYLDGI
jgi:glutaredoxin